jgi:hypothetical protein
MYVRLFLLTGLLMSSAAFAQQPNFDFANDSIRKVVRDSAASQYATLQALPPAASTTKPKPAAVIDLSPPEKPILIKAAAAKPAPQLNGFLSGMFEVAFDLAIESLLGRDPPQEWRACDPALDTPNRNTGKPGPAPTSNVPPIVTLCAMDPK